MLVNLFDNLLFHFQKMTDKLIPNDVPIKKIDICFI